MFRLDLTGLFAPICMATGDVVYVGEANEANMMFSEVTIAPQCSFQVLAMIAANPAQPQRWLHTLVLSTRHRERPPIASGTS